LSYFGIIVCVFYVPFSWYVSCVSVNGLLSLLARLVAPTVPQLSVADAWKQLPCAPQVFESVYTSVPFDAQSFGGPVSTTLIFLV
jgi:hypothetical protein